MDVFPTPNPHWQPTTDGEMKAFVVINIAMGISNLPEYKDYWSEEPILHSAYIAKIILRRGCEKLCQYFHWSLAGNEDAADKLTKIRPLISVCEQNFGSCFQPGRDLSIDETMIRFDGRLAWKQYMSKKPVKVGCLCDSRLLPRLLRIYRNITRQSCQPRPWQPGSDEGYGPSPAELPSSLCGQLLHIGPRPAACGHTTRATRREFPKTLSL